MDFGLDQPRAAIVAIDLHRGHLDPEVATMPVAATVAERVIAANARLFAWARGRAIPVIHMLTCYRDDTEIRVNPFWNVLARNPRASRRNALRHNLKGGPGVQIMPALLDPADSVCDTKKRYDCFVATDLEFRLRALSVNTLLITGVNTNSCVLATAIAANVRDYSVVVVRDCVDTMDSPELHEAALACLGNAFAHVLDTAALIGGALDTAAGRAG